MRKWIVIALAIVSAALALTGVAIEKDAIQLQAVQSLAVDSRVQFAGEGSVGQQLNAVFVLTNPTRRPVQIVGANDNCDVTGCIEAVDLPVTITAGATRTVKLSVKAARPGYFSHDIELYTDCPGQPKLTLTVEGRALEEGTADASLQTLRGLFID